MLIGDVYSLRSLRTPAPGAAAQDAAHASSLTTTFERVLEEARTLAAAGDPPQTDGGREDEALRAAVQSFESYFIHQLLKGMRRTIPEGGLFEKSFARDVYEDAIDQATAENMAAAGGIGLGELLYNQLAKAGAPSTGSPSPNVGLRRH